MCILQNERFCVEREATCPDCAPPPPPPPQCRQGRAPAPPHDPQIISATDNGWMGWVFFMGLINARRGTLTTQQEHGTDALSALDKGKNEVGLLYLKRSHLIFG